MSQLSKLWRNDRGSTGKQITFKRDFGVFFVYAKNVIGAIWKLTLRHVLTASLELKILCENNAFVLNNNYKYHNFAQLLIGHQYAHQKNGAFSLDMSIYFTIRALTRKNHSLRWFVNNKGTDQPAQPDQHLCYSLLESTICKLATGEFLQLRRLVINSLC